jgi:hypothetical protein
MDWHGSRHLFVHGLLGVERAGTCLSVPVLIVAIGRRLGYPLFLVRSPHHLFCRWEDRGTGVRFNVESNGTGMANHPDEHYRRWPAEWPALVSETEAKFPPEHQSFLRSLSAEEEMAAFLAVRGHCLEHNGVLKGAAECYFQAMNYDDWYLAYVAFMQRVVSTLNASGCPTVFVLPGAGSGSGNSLFGDRAGMLEPAPIPKDPVQPLVKFVVRECPGFEKIYEPQDRPFRIVQDEVWISREELDYLQRLRTWQPGQLEGTDIAGLNLACAVGLPGSEGLVIQDLCKVVDEWAEHIRQETERNYLHFVSYPEEYKHSEPFWRMLLLTSILQQHYGIRYNPKQIQTYRWDDSRDQFIHGLLGPQRTGTCPSIPVLIVALGRRLGYPLWLCAAPGHVFTRWADRQTGFA